MMFFALNKVKNGPKRPYNSPKRAKNASKKAKGKKGGIFLSGIGGYPPPLNGQSLCSKKLNGKGGVLPPTPLKGQNPLSSF